MSLAHELHRHPCNPDDETFLDCLLTPEATDLLIDAMLLDTADVTLTGAQQTWLVAPLNHVSVSTHCQLLASHKLIVL